MKREWIGWLVWLVVIVGIVLLVPYLLLGGGTHASPGPRSQAAQTYAEVTLRVGDRECARIYQTLAADLQASPALRAAAARKTVNDCYLTVMHSEVRQGTSPRFRWILCSRHSDSETITGSILGHTITLATATDRWTICYNNTLAAISGVVCWVDTFPGYGGGNNFCGGAPPGPGSMVAAEDDWYFYPYPTPWWHLNHGFATTCYFPDQSCLFSYW